MLLAEVALCGDLATGAVSAALVARYPGTRTKSTNALHPLTALMAGLLLPTRAFPLVWLEQA
jgi:hypothetical protein